jgi:glycosyltransferase involved in cell wall biosynthesis
MVSPVRMLVVIPALNEEVALPALIQELREKSGSLGVEVEPLVVDDGSGDHTAAVAYSAGARVLRLCHNLGIGGAVQSGLRLALREGFDCAVQCDGDGQHPPGELDKLLGALSATPPPDLVVGSRYRTREGFRSTALRRLGSRWLVWLLRILGLKVSDPTSGFRLYGHRALQLFDRTYPYDYPEPEALAIARAARLRIVEVPVTMRERQGGASSIRPLHGAYYMFKVTLAVILAYWRNRWRRKEA